MLTENPETCVMFDISFFFGDADKLHLLYILETVFHVDYDIAYCHSHCESSLCVGCLSCIQAQINILLGRAMPCNNGRFVAFVVKHGYITYAIAVQNICTMLAG